MGTKVPGNEGSWKRTFQGTKVPPTVLSLKVLWYESSSYPIRLVTTRTTGTENNNQI